MQEDEGRSVQDARQQRLRSGRSGAVSVAHKFTEGAPVRRSIDRSSDHTLPASVQVEAAAGQHARQSGRLKDSASRGAAAKIEKRKAELAAKIPFVSGRSVSRAAGATGSNVKRSSYSDQARMGGAQSGVRPRGGASHPCPLCAQATRVLRTTKVATTVQRHRRCMNCHHEYLTTERRSK